MVEPGVVDGLVTELLQPDRHDPTCPFKTHCYCDDGAPHDAVQHPLARKAADTLLALKAEVEKLNAECERAWEAYRIAHDQAMDNGEAANGLKAEVEELRAGLEAARKSAATLAMYDGSAPVIGRFVSIPAVAARRAKTIVARIDAILSGEGEK